MPSKSQKQHDFMVIACKDPSFAKKNGIDQHVACHFIEEDKKYNLWQTDKRDSVYHKWGTKSNVVIRLAKVSDFREVFLFRKFASQESSYVNAFDDLETTEGHLKGELEIENNEVWLALDGRSVVGQIYINQRGEAAYVRLIAIRASERGTGLAYRLLSKAAEMAKRLGLEYISLTVNEKNTMAIKFYERHGFKPGKRVSTRAIGMTVEVGDFK